MPKVNFYFRYENTSDSVAHKSDMISKRLLTTKIFLLTFTEVLLVIHSLFDIIHKLITDHSKIHHIVLP